MTRSHDGSFAWFDHRTHYLSAGVPPQVEDASRKTRVFGYRIPLRIDGRRAAIDGTLFWVGAPAGPSKSRIVVAGVVFLLGCAALVLVTRRRRRGGRDGGAAGGEPAKEAW
jgi:hypothetical protein